MGCPTVSNRDPMDEGVFRLVRKAVDYKKSLCILFYDDEYLCSTDKYVVVVGKDGQFLANNIDYERIAAAKPSDFRIKPLKETSPLVKEVEKRGRDVGEFYWQTAFHMSNGELLEGCREEDVVNIKQWPNFTRLVRTPNTYRITALLTERATSLDMAARLLEIQISEVNQYYSAAYHAGYAEVLNRPPEKDIQFTPHHAIGIIKQLINRFRR